MTRLALAGVAAALLLALPSAAADVPPVLTVPAWTETSTATWPAAGTLDVSASPRLGGFIGLCPTGVNWQGSSCPVSTGEVTFTWYADPAGEQVTGVQGFPLSSLIVSNALLNVPNEGP